MDEAILSEIEFALITTRALRATGVMKVRLKTERREGGRARYVARPIARDKRVQPQAGAPLVLAAQPPLAGN